MRPASSLASSLCCLAVLARTAAATCESFGMDFQDGGSYFQNSLSTDPFTFVTEFEGCQNDTANNILVDPNGNQYLCTNTNLEPDDTNQMSTCPLEKDQLFSGYWAVVVISNNDGGDPIAYQRNFSLAVGPQSTSTYTPTVIATVVTTPVVNYTTTSTDIVYTTLPTETVTSPSVTITPTVTVTPPRVVITRTSTLTLTETKLKVVVTKSTVTKTASCKLPTRRPSGDPTCRITPTIITAAALQTPQSAKFRVKDRQIHNFERAANLEERKAQIGTLDRRAPDPQPLVVTDSNTADWTTTTTTSTAPDSTLTVYSYVTSTSTVSPTATVLKGKTTAHAVTSTAPTPTKTKTKEVISVTKISKTTTITVVITSKTTPAASVTACRKAGGVLM